MFLIEFIAITYGQSMMRWNGEFNKPLPFPMGWGKNWNVIQINQTVFRVQVNQTTLFLA